MSRKRKKALKKLLARKRHARKMERKARKRIKQLKRDRSVNVTPANPEEKLALRPLSEAGPMDWVRKDIDPRLLKMDPYQREQGHAAYILIAQEWYWPAIGFILVSEREDGSFFAFDGGHRICGAIYRGDIATLPCQVLKGLTRDQEAWIFLRFNATNKRPTTVEVFGSEVIAKNEEALSIKRTLSFCDLKIGSNPTDPNVCRSVKSIRMTHKLGGPELVRLVATFLNMVWPEEPERLSAVAWKGATKFVRIYAKHMGDSHSVLDEGCIATMRKANLQSLKREAVGVRDQFHRGVVDGFCHAMLTHYNKRKRGKSRLPQPLII